MAALTEDALDRLIDMMSASIGRAETLENVLEQLLNAHCSFFTKNSDEFMLLFQGRVLLNLQRDSAEDLEPPFLRYIEEIERRVSPFMAHRVEPARVRRLACALAGFVAGFFSFAMIGMTEEEIGTSLEPLRHAFVAAAVTFLGR